MHKQTQMNNMYDEAIALRKQLTAEYETMIALNNVTLGKTDASELSDAHKAKFLETLRPNYYAHLNTDELLSRPETRV